MQTRQSKNEFLVYSLAGVRRSARRAFTLVELLIVMAVLVILAAVTLPSVKELLKDQKVSQGARLVQGFAESCRARAIATGRPVAMILDRNFLDATGAGAAGAGTSGTGVEANDTVTRLTVGEVFPPYQGDWAGTLVTISGSGTPGLQNATVPLAQAASLWDSNNSQPSGMVETGDVIQFGDSSLTYRIAGPVFLTGANLNIPFENPPQDPVFNRFISEGTIFPPDPANAAQSVPMRFRIFRKPSKSLAGSVTLPRGICVDLSVSGAGRSGRQFGAESISGNSVPTPAGYYGPVLIVFSPSGKVQDLYYHTTIGGSHTSAVRHPAGDMIHLMVGRSDQVFSNPHGNLVTNNPGYLNQAVIPSPAASARDDVKYNVLDAENYWVSINPFSGAVFSSQVQELANAPGVTGATLADTRMVQSRALAIHGYQRTDP